jgi:hypothetical protein
MPFIGNQPALSYTSFAKQDFTTSATTSYTLDQPVANENEIALFINFVRQEPTTAYTASGTTLTLTSATSASDDMYCVFLGKAVQTVNPPNGSVGISQLSATGTKDSTTFLRGDNTFASAGGTNTPAFSAVVSTDTNLGTATTLVPFDHEIFDTDGCYDNTSGNYKFTPTTAGKYYIGANMYGFGLDDQDQVFWMLYYNGTQATYNSSWTSTGATNRAIGAFVGAVLDFNGTTDYVQVYINSGQNSFTIDNGNYATDANMAASNFFGYKIIE